MPKAEQGGLVATSYEPRTSRTTLDKEKHPSPPIDQVEVSVVIPCLNEAEGVGICVQKALSWFERAGVRGEVVVADNGSTDGSQEIAAKAGARVVHEPRRGYGAAYLRGLAEAQGKYLVMADADDTYDLSNLADLLAPLEQGYDLVVGNRLAGGIQPGAMPWLHRYVGTPMISWALRLFSGAKVGDSQCGMRAFTREAYERMQLRSTGMEFASEMILKAYRAGLEVTEVPVPYHPRIGESKLRTFRDGWRHLRFLLLYSPGYTFTGLAAFLFVLGLIAQGIALTTSSGVHVGSLDWQPRFIGTILLITGFNAFMLGVVAKAYAAVKGMIPEDWQVRLARRLRMEHFLLAAGGLLLVGLGIDAFIFQEWLRLGDAAASREGMASTAQALIIMGINLGFASFLMGLIDLE